MIIIFETEASSSALRRAFAAFRLGFGLGFRFGLAISSACQSIRACGTQRANRTGARRAALAPQAKLGPNG